MTNSGNAGLDALADAIADRVIKRLRVEQKEQPILVSVKDAARLLGRTPRSLYDMINRGDIRSVRQGGRVQIRREDIDNFVEMNTSHG